MGRAGRSGRCVPAYASDQAAAAVDVEGLAGG